MKVSIKVTETTVKHVIVDVDSMDEMEIRAELDRMICEGEINMEAFDDCTEEITIIGKVEDDEDDS